MIDVERARRDTPGAATVLHFDNAGASLMPNPVLHRVTSHLRREAEIGGYAAAAEAGDELNGVYRSIGDLISAVPEEIAIVENATRAWDMAFYALRVEPGQKVVTTTSSYASNFIAFMHRRRRDGIRIEVVPDDPEGDPDLEVLEKAVDDMTALVALTHAPANTGLIAPAAEVGRIAREAGVPFLLDACQSVGQMPVDVTEIGCTMLSATSRKFLRGPRGVGFLYVDARLINELDPPFLDLRAAEWKSVDDYAVAPSARRFENWESNVSGVLGLGAAVDYARSWGLATIAHYTATLADVLRDELAAIPGVHVADKGTQRGAIVSFWIEGLGAVAAQEALAEIGINTTAITRNWALLDFERRDLPDVVRASVHYFNTNAEVERFCRAVHGLTTGAGTVR